MTVAALGASLIVATPAHAEVTQVQILATNDFHGRIVQDAPNGQAGAAVLAGAVDQLRAQIPNTVFAAAGDLIGASTFESFIQHDKPTIDALNAAGLEVSAVGNHELDQGYDDLVSRVMAPYDATTNPYGGAQWQYIAANLKVRATGDDAVPATWIKEFGDVEVGFVGAVTEDLPSLVSPAGIEEISVAPIVQSVNAEAAALVAEGADLVVMLVHEGAPSASCETMRNGGVWANIINNISPDVDAIVSGHTHLAYDCSFPVQQWVTEGRPVTERPVVSAGQYGVNLNQLVFTVDGATGVVQAKTQKLLPLLTTPPYPADTEVAGIVAAAQAVAKVEGEKPLGQIGGAFNRAQLSTINAQTGLPNENRGGESTLGNLVAEVQQWATEKPETGAAQIAFMNPGGLRQDMTGTGTGAYPRVLTYQQAAVVQPFANTLVNMRLTGAQIKTVLEQQWQRNSLNVVPARPYLRLGVSEGFDYTYTERLVTEFPLDNPQTPENEALVSYTAPRGTVTGMWLNGEPIDPAATYSVTVNSFLGSGGDNFFEFAKGTSKRDTGKVDLAAMVDYMAAFAATTPLPVDYAQHAVEVAFPAGAPTAYKPGATVGLDVQSWSMSTAADLKDTQIVVSLDGHVLGTAPVSTVLGTDPYDNLGTATISVVLPASVPLGGSVELLLTGANTGTSVRVPLAIAKADSTTVGLPNKTFANSKGNGVIQFTTTVTAEFGTPVVGDVTIYDGATPIATATLTEASQGIVKIKLPALGKGEHSLTVSYEGSDTVSPSTSEPVTVVVK